MANTPVAMFRGAATTTLTTQLYAAPSNTKAVVTNIVIANNASTSATATISMDGTVVVPTITVPANTIVPLDIKQVLAATKTITGGASATTVTFHISGMEIS